MFPRSALEDDISSTRKPQQRWGLAVLGRGFNPLGYFWIARCIDDKTLRTPLIVFPSLPKKSRHVSLLQRFILPTAE